MENFAETHTGPAHSATPSQQDFNGIEAKDGILEVSMEDNVALKQVHRS